MFAAIKQDASHGCSMVTCDTSNFAVHFPVWSQIGDH